MIHTVKNLQKELITQSYIIVCVIESFPTGASLKLTIYHTFMFTINYFLPLCTHLKRVEFSNTFMSPSCSLPIFMSNAKE